MDKNPTPTSAPTAAVPPGGRPPAADSDVPRGDSSLVIAMLSGGCGEKIGPFRLEKQLGAGGMGWVFRAWDESLERPVALKVIAPELARQPESLARLRTEARAAARLSHPHIVTVYSFGEDRGSPYIAMEYLEGKDLSALLAERGALPLAEALRLIREAAEALEYAHRLNVIHRDIKPSNILVTTEGSARVMDFGLAKRVDVDPKMTATGLVVGTPAYMAPEQAMGKQVDFRADIYALGCTLFAAMSGRPPFEGTGPVDIMVKHISEEMPVPAEWFALKNGRLVQVLGRMTAKEPAARYQQWSEVVADLRLLEGNHPTIPMEPTSALPPTKVLPQASARRWPLVGGVAAVVVLLAIGAAAVALRRPGPPAPRPAAGAPPVASASAPVTVAAVPAAVPTPAPPLPTPLPTVAPQPAAGAVAAPAGPRQTPIPPMMRGPAPDLRERNRAELVEMMQAGNFLASAERLQHAVNRGEQGPLDSDGQASFPRQIATMRALALTESAIRSALGKPAPTWAERTAVARQKFSEAVTAGNDTAAWNFFLYLRAVGSPDAERAGQWLRANRPEVLLGADRQHMLNSINLLYHGPGPASGRRG